MRSRVSARLFGNPTRAVTLGRFEIMESLGAGGMGSVYLASDPKLGRDVAVKLLHPGSADDEGQRNRLVREARALARLSHPNVVQIYEVGEHGSRIFLAMEYVQGESLERWQRRDDRGWREIVDVYLQAARGLAAAHAAGLVHRDFKPANVLVGDDGRVRVADFGLAREPGAYPAAGSISSGSLTPRSRGSSGPITKTGARLGTPAYMSPEQRKGGDVDARSDQWSYCVALWEALCGVRPSEETTASETKAWPSRGRVPAGLWRMLQRGLKRDPGARWPSMEALGDALAALSRRRRAIAWGAAAGAALVLAVGYGSVLAARDPEHCAEAEAGAEAMWSAARREVVAGALAREAGSLGADTSDALLRRLDDYRGRWLTARRALCEQAPAAAEIEARDRAIACLGRASHRFGSLLDLIETSGTGVVAGSDAVFDTLGEPSACAAGSEREPTEAERPLLELSERADLLAAVGRHVEARAVARMAHVAAVGLGHPVALVHALRSRGIVESELGWAQDGAADLRAAVKIAVSERMDAEVAELWLSLVDIALRRLRDTERARDQLEHAEAAIARIGQPPALVADFERLAGVVAGRDHDVAAAQAHFDRALQELDALGPGYEASRERTWSERGNMLLASGDIEGARVEYRRAAESRSERLGADHPAMAGSALDLGRAARAAGELDAARGLFTDALERQTVQYGETSPRLSSALIGLAQNAWLRGDIEEAERLSARALGVQDRLPPSHAERGSARILLGMIAETQERFGVAAGHHLAAAVELDLAGRDDAHARAINKAGWDFLQIGDTANARALFGRLLGLADGDGLFHAYAAAGLGRAAYLDGEVALAVPLLEDAMESVAPFAEANPTLLAEIQWHLAEGLHAHGIDADRVASLARSAYATYRDISSDEEVAALRRLADECDFDLDLETNR